MQFKVLKKCRNSSYFLQTRWKTCENTCEIHFDLRNKKLCPRVFSQSCGTGQQRRASSSVTTPQHQSAAAACHTMAAASCSAHRRPSMPQTKRTCQQPTFVHQDELWLTQTQRHANRSPPPVTRGLLNSNADSLTDDGKDVIDLWSNGNYIYYTTFTYNIVITPTLRCRLRPRSQNRFIYPNPEDICAYGHYLSAVPPTRKYFGSHIIGHDIVVNRPAIKYINGYFPTVKFWT